MLDANINRVPVTHWRAAHQHVRETRPDGIVDSAAMWMDNLKLNSDWTSSLTLQAPRLYAIASDVLH